MLESIKQLITFAGRTKKFWIIPLVVLLIIISVLIVIAEISPVPVFLYPLI